MDWRISFRQPEHLIVISAHAIRQAEKRIEACENCCPAGAEIPFDWIFAEITGSDSTITEYFMENPAVCPGSGRDIFEKTLFEPIGRHGTGRAPF